MQHCDFLENTDYVRVVKLQAPPVGPGRVRLPSSLVAFLKPNFSYRYQYAEGIDGMGAKKFLVRWNLERKRNSYDRQHTGWPKKFGTIILYALTLPNIDQFSKLFHYQNQDKFVIIQSLKIPPRLKCVATLPCEM